MKKELFAVCPRCGKRARIVSYRWDWYRGESIAQIRCTCGRSEMPYEESRVIPVDIRDPYQPREQFDLLIPESWVLGNMWNKIGQCLMDTWARMDA